MRYLVVAAFIALAGCNPKNANVKYDELEQYIEVVKGEAFAEQIIYHHLSRQMNPWGGFVNDVHLKSTRECDALDCYEGKVRITNVEGDARVVDIQVKRLEDGWFYDSL